MKAPSRDFARSDKCLLFQWALLLSQTLEMVPFDILRAHRIMLFKRVERLETVAPDQLRIASDLHDIGKALVHEEAMVPAIT